MSIFNSIMSAHINEVQVPFEHIPGRQTVYADQMLTPSGWRRHAHVAIGADGVIEMLGSGCPDGAVHTDILLPAPGNAHAHSFQRAMAGLTENRGPGGRSDDFWGWRETMYRFLDRLTPEDIGIIAAQVQMETLEAGYAAIGEFHYLHHQADGSTYANPLETTNRLLESAEETGVGYTHLPVLYMQGGLDGRPLEAGQRRFGLTPERFSEFFDSIRAQMNRRPADFRLGAAAHSVRAVSPEGLALIAECANDAPLHIHIAEQTAEVDEAVFILGARPVEWLLDHADVDESWCLIHATHMSAHEIRSLAATRSVVAVCPITEANLGDGVFSAGDFVSAGGRIAIGSDSNIRVALAEEVRLLEYSQRLSKRKRTVLSDDTHSCGRYIYERVVSGGAQALGRNAGRIETGAIADLVALNGDSLALAGLTGDRVLDAWLFAGDDSLVSDVWAAGRHVVKKGKHVRRDEIAERYAKVVRRLREEL